MRAAAGRNDEHLGSGRSSDDAGHGDHLLEKPDPRGFDDHRHDGGRLNLFDGRLLASRQRSQ